MNYRELIIKFLAGEITDSDINILKEWLEESLVNRRIFDEENELWQESAIKSKLEDFNTDKAWHKLSSHVGLGGGGNKKVVILSRNNFRIFIVAASIAFLICIGGLTFFIAGRLSDKQIVAASTIVCTKEGEKAMVFLADSTKVYLNSGSTLTYKTDYNSNERTVRLNGEAFFDVTTNPEKPFVVHWGK